MSATVQETIDTLHETLRGYIEATYHIADPGVVAQRRQLLEAAGGIFQIPFLESTPRYVTGARFAEMTDIPAAAREAYERLSDPKLGKPLLFDPPYAHQAEAIGTILRDGHNLMIMTGTGSGKTESFLLPILGKLAIEARERSQQFAEHAAVRAMVLYPMNALVNDQLGRLRLLFGNTRVIEMFEQWAGRPATFARYTSRTPYAGVRNRKKDGRRLKSIGDFFVQLEQAADRHAQGSPIVASEDKRAFDLVQTLREKGKWPAKGRIADWFGSGNWLDSQGQFRRAVTLEDDAELITRYEAQSAPPDLIITNYSMLEYMMLRPIERPIFERTRAWLKACPDEKFLIVLDEAHLYRGAQGAEVGLLLRRLRERLEIPAERFQVICATASFSEVGKIKAGVFGAALSGADPASFDPVPGDYKLRPDPIVGSKADIDALLSVNLDGFYAESESERNAAIAPFLAFRGVNAKLDHGPALHAALETYGPFSKVVNDTMRAARSFDELRELIFPDAPLDAGDRAINALLALGSRARLKPNDASLLPCRVHAFHRGLPGLWACMDPDCETLEPNTRGGPIGRLYAQPRNRCNCGAPVLEYYTCRYCGTSYARAYVKDAANPEHLYTDPGEALLTEGGAATAFQALDLLLETPPTPAQGLERIFDLMSGLLDPDPLGPRTRSVYLTPQTATLTARAANSEDDEDDGEDGDEAAPAAGNGQFVPCGCCGRRVRGGKSSVQDHVTKGDQPFQALLAAQIKVQPPGPTPATEFAPLRGRKVLVFSDSRQVAARLAPTLQLFSLRDTLRALLPVGYRDLMQHPGFGPSLTLDRAWLAVVVAAYRLDVRLRPELEGPETMPRVENTPSGEIPDTPQLFELLGKKPPANLTKAIFEVLRDNILGLEPLAIASLVEAPGVTKKLLELPDLPGLAATPDQKIAVVRVWLRAWMRKNGVWFRDMPDSWWGPGQIVRAHKGVFTSLKYVFSTGPLKTAFAKLWLPTLLQYFTEDPPAGRRMEARNLSLVLGGDWRRCAQCTSVHRPIETVQVCVDCGSSNVQAFDPDADLVFNARKGFYRSPVMEALAIEHPTLMSLIAAEHTAQLNAAQADEAFSHAEHHEMQFQDIDLAWKAIDQHKTTSIDVLSSTTTMEVGIDIGALSGVALRNMPPGRANYQQRAGRAGRRGNAVATVIAFGSADSHDDHYFTSPREMIRGEVIDPRLTLENPNIARRHIRAFLLQRYHEARMQTLDLSDESLANLFSVLGTVGDFKDPSKPLSRADLAAWLQEDYAALTEAIDRWLPSELSSEDRAVLLGTFSADLLGAVDEAIDGTAASPLPPTAESEEDKDEDPLEVAPWVSADDPKQSPDPDASPPELDPQPDNDALVDAAADNLLDRLLYWGVLPRYAFPTDVAPFYVFSPKSTAYRAKMEFAPSQGLNIALSQYAPNKQIWINNKQYTSRAIYSPYREDRRNAWGKRRLYSECSRCGHAMTEAYDNDRRGELITCEACKTPQSFGPAKPWFRPPGFAHPWYQLAPSTPDEPNETAYATRAKLVMPSGGTGGMALNPRLTAMEARPRLLVSNSGPDSDGYDYCTKCGRIESVSAPVDNIRQPHPLPYPNDKQTLCDGIPWRGVVLGADFPTDIALFALRLEGPFRLPPTNSETLSAMRTICEALAKAACRLLEIEVGEILAEYRPALNSDAGATGTLIEVFLYDTLAGGAGFSPQLASRGLELFQTALGILDACSEQCDSSCYRCLRSFRNRLDHAMLDRHVGAQILGHILTGDTPTFSPERAAMALIVLGDELERQLGGHFEITRAFHTIPAIKAPLIIRRKSDGAETLIDIHSPVARDIPIFGTYKANAIVVDEQMVRRHLGEVVERISVALR
ncbi:MAG: DEAD/DEAH box helicase [Alphaproteobacteria bacterium HGW-Alphaproteobacteria-2]|nr:MAG: DEAD/DEAH box helicase [Alphaproteobacteria bacterium HGW-Alphaproteobacteria-2]